MAGPNCREQSGQLPRRAGKSDEARTHSVQERIGCEGNGAGRLGGPDVPMMQSAYLRNRDDRIISSFLSVSVLRSVAIQSHVAAESVVQAHDETPIVPKLSCRTAGTPGTEEQPGSCVRRRRDLRRFSM